MERPSPLKTRRLTAPPAFGDFPNAETPWDPRNAADKPKGWRRLLSEAREPWRRASRGAAPSDTPEKVLEESVQLRVGCSLQGRPHEAGGGRTHCHAITVCRPEGALARLRDSHLGHTAPALHGSWHHTLKGVTNGSRLRQGWKTWKLCFGGISEGTRNGF